MKFKSSAFLAGLASAALAGGVLLSPPTTSAQDDLRLLVQGQEGQNQNVQVTISGTAINPDGTPGAKLPVHLKYIQKELVGADGDGGGGGQAPPPDLLQQGPGGRGAGARQNRGQQFKTLAKGMTDDSGRFSFKVKPPTQGNQTIFVDVGDRAKSPWISKPVDTKGKDVDLGNLQLQEPAGKGSR